MPPCAAHQSKASRTRTHIRSPLTLPLCQRPCTKHTVSSLEEFHMRSTTIIIALLVAANCDCSSDDKTQPQPSYSRPFNISPQPGATNSLSITNFFTGSITTISEVPNVEFFTEVPNFAFSTETTPSSPTRLVMSRQSKQKATDMRGTGGTVDGKHFELVRARRQGETNHWEYSLTRTFAETTGIIGHKDIAGALLLLIAFDDSPPPADGKTEVLNLALFKGTTASNQPVREEDRLSNWLPVAMNVRQRATK